MLILHGVALLSNMKIVCCQQRLPLCVIYNKGKYKHRRELFRSRNVYQLNVLKNVMFLHKTKMSAALNVFLSKFRKPSHSYPIMSSVVNYVEPTYKLSICKYRISVRGPYLWNNCLFKKEKNLELTSVFKTGVK